MQKWIIGASVVILLIISLASAYAFSASLINLHIHSGSFAKPNVAAPMTYADESQIGTSQPNMVRFETVPASKPLCQHEKQGLTAGF